jgi:hypothetical protein
MANGRNPRKSYKSKTNHQRLEDGQFIALPWALVDSEPFGRLSFSERALLLEIARQYSIKKLNNGQLKASHFYLKRRGFGSKSTISKGLRALEAFGFIYQTRQGRYPNVTSLYALTWIELYDSPEFDEGAFGGFRRCAYKMAGSILQRPKKIICTKFIQKKADQVQILNNPSTKVVSATHNYTDD